MIATVPFHARVELMSWNELHQLGKNQLLCRHARPLSEKNPDFETYIFGAFSNRARKLLDASPCQRASSDE
jgi:hypothetical protein